MLEWAVAMRPIIGEEESGDSCLVCPTDEAVVVAVVDGLGHGASAALAARMAMEAIRDNPGGSVEDLLLRSHEALRRTRGAVEAIGVLPRGRGTMTWLSVGNIDGVVVRRRQGDCVREPLASRGGVVGYQLPSLRASVVPLVPGDLLVMATDGISSNYRGAIRCTSPARENAERILASHGKDSDDALILVARYTGGADAQQQL